GASVAPQFSGTHAWVAKFNPNLTGATSLVFSLHLGTVGYIGNADYGTAIAVDRQFNIYVGGYTSFSFARFGAPGNISLKGVATPTLGQLPGQDGWVVELKGDSPTEFVYGTIVNGDEINGNITSPAGSLNAVTGIALDSIGQAYISGYSNHTSLICNGASQA